ncbi:unnamed protein product [Prunus armeniaca]
MKLVSARNNVRSPSKTDPKKRNRLHLLLNLAQLDVTPIYVPGIKLLTLHAWGLLTCPS